MVESEQVKKFRPNKKDLVAVACILMMALSVAIVQGQIPFPSFVQSKVLGTYNMVSWVPFFMLCDPPGNGSTATFNLASYPGFIMRFEGKTSEFEAVGEFEGGGSFGFSTPSQFFNDKIMIVLKLNQTWQIVRYSSFGHEWTEAHLVNCSNIGHREYFFSDLSGIGAWIDDPTNTTSEYNIDFNVEAGVPLTETLEFVGNIPRSIGAGYNISLMGEEVSIGVSIEPLNNSITLSYSFSNGTEPMTARLFSDAPITRNPLQTEGVLIWFG